MEEITVITGTSGTLGTAVLNELLKKGHIIVSRKCDICLTNLQVIIKFTKIMLTN